MTHEQIAAAERLLEERNRPGLTESEIALVKDAVREVDPRLEFLIARYQENPWTPPTYHGCVVLRAGKHRFAAPYRDGMVAPFDVTTLDETKPRATEAARELREFWEKNL